MDFSLWQYALYLAPAALIMWVYLRRHARTHAADREALARSVEAGLTEPVSLHPVVDPLRCIGSGGCASACPERAIGVVDGKATLVDPAACIGHGACAAACPVQAIRLVFGTAKRGIDIPQLTPSFETNVPGIFVAGELGGMGLIRKAAEQGRQAVEAVRRRPRAGGALDLIIVGAGPAGLAAALAAKQAGLRFLTLEQEHDLGGSILHYPRRKIAMTQPVKLPLVGTVRWREISKENMLDFWRGVLREQRLGVHFGERVQAVRRVADGFSVTTTRGEHRAGSVLLCVGRRGTPRKLEVPGEELAKVVYRLDDATQYRGQHVLVVGGGDSAVEAALAVSDEPGTRAALSYRGASFSRIKPKNRERLENARAKGTLQLLLESEVAAIEPERIVLKEPRGKRALRNDAVIVCAGGVLPTQMLKDIGVLVQTHHGTEAQA